MVEKCDYDAVAAEFPWVLEKNQKVIVSADIDGIASALLLNAVLGCQVDGVCTQEYLWTNPGLVEGDPDRDLVAWGGRFLGHDINRTTICSVGHSLLNWSAAAVSPAHSPGSATLNPNLLRGISFKHALNRRYPFGSIHFLLGFFGQVVAFRYRPSRIMATLLMHIHSCFLNALKHPANALDWVEWLGGSGEGSPLRLVCEEMLRFSPPRVLQRFKQLGDAFEALGLRGRSQVELRDPNDMHQAGKMRALIAWLSEETGWPSPFGSLALGRLLGTPMECERSKPTKATFESVIATHPFSYAIVGGGNKSFHFNWFAAAAPEGA